MNYYNDNDPKSADWLRRLVAAGLIPAGYVDQRSILDITPDDLEPYTQCHFFAGIGGWSLALAMAGVGPSTRLWTGSCPCQPFSAAGKRKGTDDERHLWPVFRDLIKECRPPVVLGEQVASADGRAWLSTVRTDLEALGYAAAGADLCAAGVGAPHIRQRIYFVGLADTERIGHAAVFGAGDTSMGGRQDGKRTWVGSEFSGTDDRPGQTDSFWSDADWLFCRDGKWRPVESGSFLLAHGIPGRVGRLRGYGNAIVPQVAAVFVRAAMQAKRKTD